MLKISLAAVVGLWLVGALSGYHLPWYAHAALLLSACVLGFRQFRSSRNQPTQTGHETSSWEHHRYRI